MSKRSSKRKQQQSQTRKGKQPKLEAKPEEKTDDVGLTFEHAKEYFLQDPEEASVYYDGGWEDTRAGTYTLNSFSGPVISHATFVRLREDGTVGGNRLITYKARRWHPVLKPGEQDESQLGDRFYRDAPFKTEEEVDREDASADVFGTVVPKRKTEEDGEVQWVACAGSKATLPKGRVLCTNNMEAADCTPAKNMTHVWTATLAVRKKYGVVGLDAVEVDGIGFCSEASGPVWNITHWAVLPRRWNPKWRLKLIRDNVSTIVRA
jgi:hypothetical protein